MPAMRLQKYLSRSGFCSRRRAELLIAQGRVRVNGVAILKPGTSVESETDRVVVDGKPVIPSDRWVYIALHKPKGVVTSCRQPGDRTVMDLLDLEERVFPIGRLDRDSSGLLLLTNDGRLHHRLSHPSFDHEKAYEVTLAWPVPDAALEKMARGMPMMGTRTRPAEVRRVSARRFDIVLKEGKNRQIRRMVRKIGNRVLELKRVRVATIRLGRLAPGRWRHLTPGEIRQLLEGSDLPPSRERKPSEVPKGGATAGA